MALSALGAARITALTEDSKNARECNAIYSLVRDSVLRAHIWNFAIKRVALESLDVTLDYEDDDMTEVYQKPSDIIRIIELNDDEAIYKMEGDYIVSDTASLKCRYIACIEDPTKYDSLFVDTLAAALAARLAYSITSSRSVELQKVQIYTEKLKEAKSVDAQEGTPRSGQQDDWLDARG